MKLPGIIVAGLALLLGFYQAPFAHIHPDDLDHVPTSAVVHWHFGESEANGAGSALTDDDDAIDVGWNAARSAPIQITQDLTVAETIEGPSFPASAHPVVTPQRRGHDPPELSVRSPRAPPL